jgi:hypothetical protein
MKMSDNAKARIAKYQELVKIKKEHGLSKFYLYRYKLSGSYLLSKSRWLANKNKKLLYINEPDQFNAFLTRQGIFIFDEEPDMYS